MRLIYRVWVWVLLLVCGSSAWGQGEPAAYKPPEDIAFRKATIISEGTRMAAELFSLKSRTGQEAADDHHVPRLGRRRRRGCGRTRSSSRGPAISSSTFDYRGWGRAKGRFVLTKPAPADKPASRFTAEVKEIREVVDPLDQTTDLHNAIHWVHGEPQCDTKRIGLWGSSYSGGHVVYAAARDHRVKAIVSQVPGLDSRFVVQTPEDAEENLQ